MSSNDCDAESVGEWRDKMTRTAVLLMGRGGPPKGKSA